MALKSMPVAAARFDPISLEAALNAGKKVAPDATQLLIQDHREVMGLFDAYRDMGDAGAKARIVRRICMDLTAHMQVEEEVFYPAARAATDDQSIINQAVEEHAEAKRLIAEIEAGDKIDADDLVRKLRQAIEDHVAMEETKVFPEVRTTGTDLYAVGQQVATCRVQQFSELTGKPVPSDGFTSANTTASIDR